MCFAELALVLAMDASGSMDDKNFHLQRQGTAQALRDVRVRELILSKENPMIAVIQFDGKAYFPIGWRSLNDEADIDALANEIENMPRLGVRGTTSPVRAMRTTAQMIRTIPCEPMEIVLDISSDGEETVDREGVEDAKAELAGLSARVNALVLDEAEVNTDGMNDGMYSVENARYMARQFYRRLTNGIGFTIEVEGIEAYTEGITRKLIREIGGIQPDSEGG